MGRCSRRYPAPSHTYYVDATNGSDSNKGNAEDSAYQTVSKINGMTFDPGDRILLKRGEVLREQLTVPSSGMAGRWLVFAPYGSGNQPVISGADLITGWTADGGSYVATVTTEPNIVLYDGTELTENDGATNTVGANEWDWNANSLWVNVGEDPDIGSAEAGARNLVCVLDSCHFVHLENLNIYGCNSATNGAVQWNVSANTFYISLVDVLVEKNAGPALRVYE